MSDNKMNLMQKIAKARVLLQKKNLKKSGLNKFAGFKYFELADFLPAVNEIFDELGLYAEFYIEPEERIIDEETGKVETSPELAHLNIFNSESDEIPRCFMSRVAEAGTKGATPIQQLGSIHTYMRRYLYMEALEIVESDALDAVVGTEKVIPSEKSKKEKGAPKQEPKQEYNQSAMAVEYTTLTGELRKLNVDIHDEKVAAYIKEKAQVNNLDGGYLLTDLPAMARVIAVMKAIIQSKK